jgi:integrase
MRTMPLHLPVERVDGDRAKELLGKKRQNLPKKKINKREKRKKGDWILGGGFESFHGCRHSFASLSVRSFMLCG